MDIKSRIYVTGRRIKVFQGCCLNNEMVEHSEVLTVIAGEAHLTMQGHSRIVGTGEVIEVAMGMEYSIRASTDLECIQIIWSNEIEDKNGCVLEESRCLRSAC
jgi:mannose-6-phosphate isomerase-like protein (cupin superfamily)